MSPDSSEVPEGYVLLGYADARLLRLYQAGEVNTLELVRIRAALTPEGNGSREAVPVYGQTFVHDFSPLAPMSEAIRIAGADEGVALDTLVRHLEEGRAESLELPRLGECEQRVDWPEEEVADYSEDDLIEATCLAMAELEMGDEGNGASYRGLPPKSAN